MRLLGAVLLAGVLCGPVEAGMLLSAASGGATTPVNTSVPQLTGNIATVGNPLACSNGTWSGGGTMTFAYQYYRDGTAIGGATTTPYAIIAADQGHSITCVVSATNSAGGPIASPASNPAGNCVQSTNWFARVWALPATLDGLLSAAASPTNHVTAYDSLVCGLVTDGVFALLDELWITATNAATGTATAVANLNLVGATCTLSPVGSPPFAANAGYTGNATFSTTPTTYINTGCTATAGTHYTNTSAHMMAWNFVDTQSTGYTTIIGALDSANGSLIDPWVTSGVSFTDLNINTASLAAFTPSPGHATSSTTVVRSDGTNTGVHAYRNGAPQTLTSASTAATAPPTTNVYLLADNNNGTVANGGPYQLGAASIGGALTAAQVSSSGTMTSGTGLIPRICTYLTAVHGSC